MDDMDALIYVIIVFFALLLLSRLINFLLGVFLFDSRAESEVWTFMIVIVLDAIAMYVMVNGEYGEGIGETFMVMFVKAFPFILFYILGVGTFDWFIKCLMSFQLPLVW